MNRPLITFLIISALCIAVVVAFLLIGHTVSSVPASDMSSTSAPTDTTASTSVINVNIPPAVTPPSLSHVVVYSADLPIDARATLATNIASTTANLKLDPSNSRLWLQLAANYKVAGDYHAAESIWIYLTKVIPRNYVAFADLGDLYQNFLKDYPKAEQNYLAAISLKPDDIDLYYDLYLMYSSQYKTGTSAAADIVAEGLKNNPDNPTLVQLQQQAKTH
ncbi:MAG TPA: hypothetical protein VG934_00090 [Candidatus Paceibacterota bacterium]|nr:hypothetical protein [Candidatus Paceibacterota bacterium]